MQKANKMQANWFVKHPEKQMGGKVLSTNARDGKHWQIKWDDGTFAYPHKNCMQKLEEGTQGEYVLWGIKPY